MGKSSRFENFANYYDKVGHPILVVNSQTLQIDFMNRAACTLKGMELDTFAPGSESIVGFFAASAADEVRALCALCLKSNDSLNAKSVPVQKRSRRLVSVDIFAARLEIEGESFLVLSLFDTSELLRFENQRREDMLERAHLARLADIGSLAAGVAHELNNPLMIIMGHAENIEYALDQPTLDKEEIRGPLQEILVAVERMGKIVRKVLTAARTEHTNNESLNPHELIEGSLKMVMMEFSDQDIQVRRDYQSHCLLRCDPLQIEQVLVNIVKNACQALTEIPTERHLELRTHQFGKDFFIEISNNGPEIPPSVQTHLFTPFFTTKEVGQGTGLGLSIAQGILAAHQGRIEVESQPGRTSFRLHFPEARLEPFRHNQTTG